MRIWIALIILLIIIPGARSQEITENTAILDIYIAENGRALVTGYLSEESIAQLIQLEDTTHVFYNDTSEIYLVTDSLSTKTGRQWKINFSLRGYFLDYNSRIYLPPKMEITDFTIPSDFSYSLGIENQSLLMEITGYQAPDPQIIIYYAQPLTDLEKEEEKTTTPMDRTRQIMAAALIVILTTLLILNIIQKKKQTQETPQKKEEITITPEMEKVMGTLSEREDAIVQILIKEGGSSTQAKIRRETGIPKSSLSGITNALRQKKIIKKREYGRTNLIELTKWFLGQTEDK